MFVEWDVTRYVIEQLKGDKIVSFALWDDAAANANVVFYSKEGEIPPELEIIFGEVPSLALTPAPEPEPEPADEPEPESEAEPPVEIKVNDYTVKFDIPPVYENGKVWASVQSVVEPLNFDFVPTEDGFIIKNEESVAIVTLDFETAKLNGTDVAISKPYKNGHRYFMALDDIMKLTHSAFEWDETAKKAVVQPPELPQARPATAQDIQITPQDRTATYKIPSADPNAEVTVWTWAKTTAHGGWRQGAPKWWKEYSPVYVPEEQAFVGTLTYLDNEVTNKVRVRVRSNGKEDIFEAEFMPEDRRDWTWEKLMFDAKTLTLVPTFHNISVYLSSVPEAAQETSEVRYRVKGESEWKDAFRLDYDARANQFKGSIVQLQEGTVYEVKVSLRDQDGNLLHEEKAEIETWKEDVPIAKTIDIKDIYTPGQNLVLQNLKGSPDGWIKIKGDGETVIDVSDEFWEAVFIARSEYVILEALIIRGGYRHGIHIADESQYIWIKNNDISGWGRAGTLDETRGLYVDHMGEPINNEAGVFIDDVSNIIVERSYFHDPKGRANPWTNQVWSNKHPQGPSDIYGRGARGIVIRYNDFVGSDAHRWNDAVETYHNFSQYGGFAGDSDFYGNFFAF